MLALLHAVFAWQAQLGGRGEEAALEAVQGELAGPPALRHFGRQRLPAHPGLLELVCPPVLR